jgi:hypothetical protein
MTWDEVDKLVRSILKAHGADPSLDDIHAITAYPIDHKEWGCEKPFQGAGIHLWTSR